MVEAEAVTLTHEYTTSAEPSFATMLHNVLSPKECLELIDLLNVKGFTPALLNIGRGRQQLRSEVRDGLRSIVDSPELSAYLCEVIAPHLPRTTSSWQGEAHLEGLNERCRFLVYKPGHYFAPHCDGQYTRPNGDCSRITVQLYLHDVPVEAGGATNFISRRGEKMPVQPRCGSALIFSQDLLHEGALVAEGYKYTMRTEAMYTLDPARARATGAARGIMGASKAPAGRECGTPDSAGDAEMDLTFSDAEFDLT